MSDTTDQEKALFNQALELPSPGPREAFLDGACRGSATRRARLDELLRAHDGASGFLPHRSTAETLPLPPGNLEGPGGVIGRYKLLQQIGEGGMGAVYMAEQTEPVRRKVALKIIKQGMDTRQVIARFESERQALALMDHPNIARVLDAGTIGAPDAPGTPASAALPTGRPYFVMELVQGLPITQFCDEARLSAADRLALFLDVCSAVQHAHQKGIIHRDLKPSNILVTLHGDRPVPKIIDFGIAKATQGPLTDKTLFTQFQQFIGTPAYMSPEQAGLSGLDVDTRADVYSLGVLLYELLTGRTPFDARELLQAGLDEMRRTIREREPLRPSTRLSTLGGEELNTLASLRATSAAGLGRFLRGDLDWIVMKCLEKDRARRYETATSLAADLRRHLADEPVTARPPSTLYRLRKTVDRHRIAVVAGLAVALALLAGGTLFAVGVLRERATLRQLVALQHRSVMDRARFAILLGDPKRIVETLQEAERAGLPPAQLGLLRGLHLITSASPGKAFQVLEEVHRLEPDNVAALGLLATAALRGQGANRFHAYIPALEKAHPTTADEHLFLGQAWGIMNPDRGLPLLEQAIRQEDSPLARLFLAEIRTEAARQTGDLALMQAALTDLQAASAWARDSLPVILASYSAHRVAATLQRRAGNESLATIEEAAAEQTSERLESFRPNAQALRARLEHLVLSGRTTLALDKSRQWSREVPTANLEMFIVWILMMQGDHSTSLELTRNYPNSPVSPLMRLVRYLAAIELPGAEQEVQGAWHAITNCPPAVIDDVFNVVAVHELSGLPEQAREVARKFLAERNSILSQIRWGGLAPLMRYLAGEIDESTLLAGAQGASAAGLAHHFIGFRHLGAGRRELAIESLRSSCEKGAEGDIAHILAGYFLKRLREDPNWPPTLRAKPAQ